MTIKKKWNSKKKWWLFLILLLPISFILRYIVTVFFMICNIWNVCWYDDLEWMVHCNWEDTIAYKIKWILNYILTASIIFWAIGFIPGIILFIKWRKE